MPATYTCIRSVQVLDFEYSCPLIPHACLICDFCSSGQRFVPTCRDFLQIRGRPQHPCCSANASPCRVHKRLGSVSLPSLSRACGPPRGATKKKTPCAADVSSH